MPEHTYLPSGDVILGTTISGFLTYSLSSKALNNYAKSSN